MKGYRKIDTSDIIFGSEMNLSDDDLYNQEERMRSILGTIATYAEEKNYRDFVVVVYAKRGEPRPTTMRR
jgi:hypothetical protein